MRRRPYGVRDTDPGATMRARDEDRRARSRARRTLFGTLVHRVGAERAVGRAPDLVPVRAADGADEFLVDLPCAGLFAPTR